MLQSAMQFLTMHAYVECHMRASREDLWNKHIEVTTTGNTYVLLC